MASQYTAGTDVSELIRSSPISFRNACTLNAGMMTVVPPEAHMGSNWLLQPVTWNSGTETSVRTLPSKGSGTMRRQVSMFERNPSCVVIAPLGKPVVPLV